MSILFTGVWNERGMGTKVDVFLHGWVMKSCLSDGGCRCTARDMTYWDVYFGICLSDKEILTTRITFEFPGALD